VDVLQDQPDLPPPGRERVAADVDPVQEDRAGGRLVETEEEVRDRGLSAPRGAGQGHALAVAHGEGHVVERPRPARVIEGDVVERQLPPLLRNVRDRAGRVGDRALRAQDAEDAVGRGEGALQELDLLRELQQGKEEASRVFDEEHEGAQRHPLDEAVFPEAEAEDEQDGHDFEGEEEAPEAVVEEGGALLRAIALEVPRAELLLRPGAPAENLQDRRCLHVLRDEGVQARVQAADRRVDAPEESQVERPADHERREEEQQPHRDLPVRGEHHDERSDQQEDRAQQRERDLGEEHLQPLGVRFDAGHQAAGGVGVEVVHPEGEQVGEGVLLELRHDGEAEADDDKRLPEAGPRAREEDREVEPGRDEDAAEAAAVRGRRDVGVDQPPQQERAGELRRHREEHEHGAEGEEAEVRPDARRDPPGHFGEAELPDVAFLGRGVIVPERHAASLSSVAIAGATGPSPDERGGDRRESARYLKR